MEYYEDNDDVDKIFGSQMHEATCFLSLIWSHKMILLMLYHICEFGKYIVLENIIEDADTIKVLNK